MDGSSQTFDTLEAEKPNPEKDEQEDECEEDDEEFDDGADDDDVQRQLSELQSSLTPIGADSKRTQSETLEIPLPLHFSTDDLQSDIATSSHHLSEVPMEYILQLHESAEFKNQVGVSHQEALVRVTAEAAQAHKQNQLQLHGCLSSSLELSPTSVTQSVSSTPSPTQCEQIVSPVANSNIICVSEVDQQKYSDPKTVSTVSIVKKIPSTDGYNWRKYGQKQVKSPQGSRSYYKCTYSECFAKKIEYCDHSNCVKEIIYKGQHNHDPPRKINSTRESRLALSVAAPVVGSNNTSHPIRTFIDKNPATSSKEPIQETPPTPETKRQNSKSSDENAQINIKEEHADEPEAKRRVKKSSSACPGSLFKSDKKPKFVVHAAGDVGISGDGYRWRKYGQKMVKGNPHPRNYYRCTSAGCPVRKHIESAVDNTTAVIITYKGIHDHDMPVPKKRHGPPSAPLVAAAAPASMNNIQFKKTEALQNQISATQWSVDKEGELTGEALDIGGDKAMESARTLLSIGFEIKPC